MLQDLLADAIPTSWDFHAPQFLYHILRHLSQQTHVGGMLTSLFWSVQPTVVNRQSPIDDFTSTRVRLQEGSDWLNSHCCVLIYVPATLA